MNNNYIKVLLLLFLGTTMAYGQQTMWVDFGGSDSSLNNYNNVISPGVSAAGYGVADMTNDGGTATGFGLVIDDAFNGVNTAGTTSPTGAAAAFDPNSVKDSFYGNTAPFNDTIEATGGFTLSGLDATKLYTFEVFASRATTENREAIYTVSGLNADSASLNPGNNDANTVIIADIQPNASGEITFLAKPGAANVNSLGFYYLGAIKMTESANSVGIEEDIVLNGGLKVYPNPADDILNIDYILNNQTTSTIAIYDMTGKIVYSASNAANQAGIYSYKWNRLDNRGNRVVAGAYFLKLSTNSASTFQKVILK